PPGPRRGRSRSPIRSPGNNRARNGGTAPRRSFPSSVRTACRHRRSSARRRSGAGVLVEGPHRIPFGSADLGPAKTAYLQPLDGRGALLAQRLAPAAADLGEEIVERGVAMIEPVILDAVPDEPAAPLGFGGARIVHEGDVSRRHIVLNRDRFGR